MAYENTAQSMRRSIATGRPQASASGIRTLLKKLIVPKAPEKPSWVTVPDITWQRHSALIMSRYER